MDAGRYASHMHTLTLLEWRPLAWVNWGRASQVDKIDMSIQYSSIPSFTHLLPNLELELFLSLEHMQRKNNVLAAPCLLHSYRRSSFDAAGA
jgi:hypothetical protein